MLEILGLVFGGVSRLVQHGLEMADKQRERQHELAMFDKQAALADKRQDHDAALRRMDVDAAQDANDTAALVAALKAQSEEATAAGGWVAKLSASVRPVLTLWHGLVLYSVIKIALLCVAMSGGLPWAQALLHIYAPEDRMLCWSMVSFWFADRSIRKRGL
jgi:hypothetical protein